jgi:hypothetical protein
MARRRYPAAMDRRTAISILKDHAAEIRDRGATSLYLYGSTARGEAGPGSDVDLFIDYDADTRKFTLIEFITLQEYLSEILGTKADLAAKDALHPLLRDTIISEAERIF